MSMFLASLTVQEDFLNLYFRNATLGGYLLVFLILCPTLLLFSSCLSWLLHRLHEWAFGKFSSWLTPPVFAPTYRTIALNLSGLTWLSLWWLHRDWSLSIVPLFFAGIGVVWMNSRDQSLASCEDADL